VSTTASALAKRLWSLKSAATNTGKRHGPLPAGSVSGSWFPFGFPSPGLVFLASAGAAGRSIVRYEGGYAVDTVFDGSKLGIEPHAVEVSPAGELLVLDSINSNIYRVQLPLSRCEHALLSASNHLVYFPFQFWTVFVGFC
jgi:hypothetical protein